MNAADAGSPKGRLDSNRLLILIGIVLSIAYWAILIFRVPLFELIPDYYWHAMVYTDTELPAIWLLLPLLPVTIFILRVILRQRNPGKWSLLLLIVLGMAHQSAFGFMEGKGIDGLRMRLVNTGHAEYAHLAVKYKDMEYFASHYEEFLEKSDTLYYIKTKPPGQLLFYMLTQRVSEVIAPPTNSRDRFVRMITFSAIAFPLLSCLVLIPLFYIARTLADDRIAVRACLLYLFIPSTMLVTMHLDQALYPLLAMTTIMALIHGCKYNNRLTLLASGALLYIALYVSFSLLPLVLICALVAWVVWQGSQEGKIIPRKFLLVLAFWGAGFCIMWLLFLALFGYNPIHRYHEAMTFHQQWKEWQQGLQSTLLFALLNIIEFLCWMGIPLAVLYLGHVAGAAASLFKRSHTRTAILSIGYAAVIILIALFSSTKGEVHRLWIFLIPLICVFVARELARRFAQRSDLALAGLLILQFVTILVIKRFQDFW